MCLNIRIINEQLFGLWCSVKVGFVALDANAFVVEYHEMMVWVLTRLILYFFLFGVEEALIENLCT